MKADKYQELALKTWYSEDDPLYLDPRHPLIKLAGEAGELLDLYGKHEYKPGFSWWKCKHCNYDPNDNRFIELEITHTAFHDYNPLVLDELGDFWYYLRIITWQQSISIEELIEDFENWEEGNDDEILDLLSSINYECARLLDRYVMFEELPFGDSLERLSISIMFLLKKLDYSIDHLTQLNYNKLNSEPTAHGWKT